MHVGGVLLAAGTEMDIAEGDYRYGQGRVRFLVTTILEVREDWGDTWIVMQGNQCPHHARHWTPRRLQVRVSALKRSMTLSAA